MTVGELPKNYISFRVMAWSGDNINRVNVTTTQEKYDSGVVGGGSMGGATFTLSGGGMPHNNIQPGIAAYCWKRTV